jgi:ribosomal protein S7
MTEPAEPDALAARLLAAHRVLAALQADPDQRRRLHLRFLAICASMRLPRANRARVAERLDRLIADAASMRPSANGPAAH